MTPQKAILYRRLLSAGIRSDYDQYIDSLLEEEQPLSELTLELACSLSDLNRTVSLLDAYLKTVTWEEAEIYPEILYRLTCLMDKGEITQRTALDALIAVFSTIPWEARWEIPWRAVADLDFDYWEAYYGFSDMNWALDSFEKLLREEVKEHD